MGANTCLSYVVPQKAEWEKRQREEGMEETNEDRHNKRTFL
jgi:hypothetical protein